MPGGEDENREGIVATHEGRGVVGGMRGATYPASLRRGKPGCGVDPPGAPG
jgi:hypothetical protein